MIRIVDQRYEYGDASICRYCMLSAYSTTRSTSISDLRMDDVRLTRARTSGYDQYFAQPLTSRGC